MCRRYDILIEEPTMTSPSPQQEDYSKVKEWANKTIKGYEVTSFALIEKLENNARWNINIKPKKDALGFCTESFNCENLVQ